jgi:hypothetical protein
MTAPRRVARAPTRCPQATRRTGLQGGRRRTGQAPLAGAMLVLLPDHPLLVDLEQAFVGTNRLMMMFDAKDFRLKQWTVTDVQGFDTTIAVSNLDTTVAVFNLDSTKKPDPNLFVINYERNTGISNQ